ncbi:hypothetical protein J1N35_002388, partial [Gossypium stocksii]
SLRQGHLISPYVLVLCQTVLSATLSKVEDEDSIKGIKMAREDKWLTWKNQNFFLYPSVEQSERRWLMGILRVRRVKNPRKPKVEGGLGVRPIALTNKALLAKQAWRLTTNPNLLITKAFKAKYYKNKETLEASDSWIWKDILKRRQVCKQLEKGMWLMKELC